MTMNSEILRFVDTIHRDRQVDKEVIFKGIELALLSAAQKRYGMTDDVEVQIDRDSGEIVATISGKALAPADLGRIAALNGKQVLYQKIREAEREVVYEEYLPKVNELMTGTVQAKKPGGVLIVNLGKAEGFLPRSEQSAAENFNEGDRIKVILKEVNIQPNRVQLLCSRGSEELVRRLFELEIPEVADFVVEIKAISREPGHRTKIAVSTYDANVDCVGACVGVKGARIRNIVDELFGEKIDIVRWNESIEILIVESLRPAEIASLDLDFDNQTAIVYVKPDQQSLAIGRRGQNVRLASKLTGWELNITPVSDEDLDRMRAEGLESMAQGMFQDRLAEAEQEAASENAALESGENKLDQLFEQAADAAASLEEETAEAEADPFAKALREHAERSEIQSNSALDQAFAAMKTDRPKIDVPLEEIPGIDADLAEKLRGMGCENAEGLRSIGENSLAGLDSFGPDLARQIFTFLNKY